jgi:hypothetical protein
MKNSPETLQPSTDERLSKEEALLYQEYATKLENKEFSEQASGEAYEEAEQLLEKLKDSNFDWLGIDWDKVDLKNSNELRDVEKRLDAAVKSLSEAEKEDGGILRRIVSNSKGVVIPLALSIALLLNVKDAKAGEEWDKDLNAQYTEYQEKMPNLKINFRVNDWNAGLYYENAVYEWAENNPDKVKNIDAIFIDDAACDVKSKKEGESYNILDVEAKTKIIILTKDKKALIVEGEYLGQDVSVDTPEYMEGGFWGEENQMRHSIASRQAIKNALDKIE